MRRGPGSEEGRVGEEGRSRWWPEHLKKKDAIRDMGVTGVQTCAFRIFALPLKSTLMLEFHGTEASTKEQAEMVQALAEENGGGHFAWTGQAEERSKMWQARHDAAWA